MMHIHTPFHPRPHPNPLYNVYIIEASTVRVKMKPAANQINISDEEVYAILSKIPPGKVSTYGDVAKAVGHPKAARDIGRIIANNVNG